MLRNPERLEGVHPDLATMVRATADALPFDVSIVEGRRSEETQETYYTWGRMVQNPNDAPGTGPNGLGRIVTNARVKKDAPHVAGLAVDLMPDPATDENYDAMGAEAENQGLTWGGSWTSLVDKPHVELPNWRSYVGWDGDSGESGEAPTALLIAAGIVGVIAVVVVVLTWR